MKGFGWPVGRGAFSLIDVMKSIREMIDNLNVKILNETESGEHVSTLERNPVGIVRIRAEL